MKGVERYACIQYEIPISDKIGVLLLEFEPSFGRRIMFKNAPAFSSYSVDDLGKAKSFYSETLGPDVTQTPEGLGLRMEGGGRVFLYPKQNHEPASFTVLNFKVKISTRPSPT